MKRLLTGMIRFYQKNISPLTPPSCRYHPTCSTYALEAVEKHGALKGGAMGIARVIRCNPFVEGGVDEVPDHFTLRRNPENIDDYFIPEYLLSVSKETEAEIEELLEKYEKQLKVSDELPSSLDTLKRVADVEELSTEAIEHEFTEEELDFLFDYKIIPELPATSYTYFTVKDNKRNKHLLKEMEPFAEGIVLGTDFPLVVLEETGIWFTNLPNLAKEFLIEHGVTNEDIKNKSYHLWLVLKAMDESV